ncbi:MAG: hypothetical protein EPO23_03175 [Xanthobacteraceae bacterium]|nr:MAG: hypothetical protein EPO23_03175 [Xanthobacteraceae bacterium]
MLTEIGIRLPDLIAGLSGGVVNALVFKRTSPFAFIGSVIVGALSANYLGPSAAQYLGTLSGAAAFLVGLAGMAICQSVVAAATRWRPNIGGRNE